MSVLALGRATRVCYSSAVFNQAVFCREHSETMTHYLEIARQQKPIQGEAGLPSMQRLHEALLALGCDAHALADVMVSYRAEGLPARRFGDQSLPMLALSVTANVPLLCQRCFEPMPQAMAFTVYFAVCDAPPEALLEDDEIDWLETGDDLPLEMLVEDELLMALPIAVKHEQSCAPVTLSAGEKPNPFAVLKQLKRE